jgi:hypothetical protein
MTSTTQYFKKSMNAIYEIDDGAGTTISDGTINCNSLTTGQFNVTDLTCTNLTASAINTYSISATESTIMNAFITSAYITSALNLLNSAGTVVLFTLQNVSNVLKFIANSPITSMIFRVNNVDALTITDTYTTVNNDLVASTANITTDNITTANITTANITNAIISNSLTVPSISTTNGIFQNIQPITNSTATNLYTNSTSTVTLGNPTTTTVNVSNATITPNSFQSSNPSTLYNFLSTQTGGFNFGSYYMNQTEFKAINPALNFSLFADNTAGLTVGGSGGLVLCPSVGSNYYTTLKSGFQSCNLDFKTSTLGFGYDTRIQSTGGTSTQGKGTLNLIAGTINLQANIIQLNSNPFRYVPWTTSFRSTIGSATISTILSVPSGGTQPTCHANANIIYRYSIVGNTMYVNFSFYQASAGTAGSGYYQYAIPAITLYMIDFTDIQASTNGNAIGTRLGTCNFDTGVHETGVVYVIGSGTSARLILQAVAGNANTIYEQQRSTYFQLNQNLFNFGFEAMFPIVAL